MTKMRFTKFKIILAVFFLFVLFPFCQGDIKRTVKEFYPSKKVKAEYEYVLNGGDTILQGKFVRYNLNGAVIAEGNNLNNEPFGKSTYYYDNGKVESIFFRKNKKISEESFEYYSNGKIKRYIMYDPFGLEAFIARYDEAGNLKSYEGFPVLEIYQYKFQHKKQFKIKQDQFLKIGDTLMHKYLVANIPKSHREFFVESVGKTNGSIKSKKVSTVQTDYKEILSKKGENFVKAIVTYKFENDAKTIIADTISFRIQVH